MSDPDLIESKDAPEPVGAYPHARRAGSLLFLSGVGPRRRGTDVVPGVTVDASGRMTSYDIEAQCESCFANVRMVLDAAGSSLDRIVDVTTFLTDLERDFEGYNRVYARWFAGPGKPNPARTTVGVSRLPMGVSVPIAVELKVIATLG